MTVLAKLGSLLNPLTLPRAIVRNKDLLQQLVLRNVNSAYRGSLLGLLWSFILPLLMVAVYTFVFTIVFKSRWSNNDDSQLAFVVNLLCGLSLFNIFSDSVSACSNEIVSKPNYVKKIVFPLEILPVARVLSCSILGLAWFVLLFWIVLAAGKCHWTLLLMPIPLLTVMLYAAGIGLFVASCGVYLRDVQQCIVVIIRILLFITPIFYSLESVPLSFRFLICLNPLAYSIDHVRKVFWDGVIPDWRIMGLNLLIGFLCAHLGMVWFLKTKKGFADVI